MRVFHKNGRTSFLSIRLTHLRRFFSLRFASSQTINLFFSNFFVKEPKEKKAWFAPTKVDRIWNTE